MNHNSSTALELSVNKGGGGDKVLLGTQPRPQLLKWFRTFSKLFSQHGETLISQLIITVKHIHHEKYHQRRGLEICNVFPGDWRSLGSQAKPLKI